MAESLALLVVDDVPLNRLLMEGIAAEVGGLESAAAADGAEALDWCARHPVDIVAVDWMMPGLDGAGFLRAFRAMPGREGVPVLVATAAEGREVMQQALELGANDFLSRPLHPAEVRLRLRNMRDLRRAHLAVAGQAGRLAAEVAAATATVRARERELVARLAGAVEHRDPETGAHVVRMALYARLIARGLGLDGAYQEMLLAAAPMHDVGKVAVPDHILLKPGRLDAAETAVMRRHAELGARILAGSESDLVRMAERVAAAHHERWDGGGYPRGLSGAAIPLEARIVAVADVFDALTSARPYKRAWALEEARDHLARERGLHFDPACVDAFLAAWPEVVRVHRENPEPAGRTPAPAMPDGRHSP